MSTRLVLRLVVADHLSLDRRQKIRSLLGRAIRDGITKLIETRRIEIGEVLVAGEFLTEECVDSKRGHRTSQKAYVTDGKVDRGSAVKRDTTKRYPVHTRGGNCWVGAKDDVCMKHEEPRGECSGCGRCLKCEADGKKGAAAE